jgi:hypothetical protein
MLELLFTTKREDGLLTSPQSLPEMIYFSFFRLFSSIGDILIITLLVSDLMFQG